MVSRTPSFSPLLPIAFTRNSILPSRRESRKRRRESPGPRISPHHCMPLIRTCALITSIFVRPEYRIAYRIREEKRQVEVVLVKTRERFYEVLAQSIR